MELAVDSPSKSPLSQNPRSVRLKKPCFVKWRDYDLDFTTDTRVRKRKRVTGTGDHGGGELRRKRCKKVVSLKEFGWNGCDVVNGRLEKPLTLDDDLFIPKQPRCVSHRRKVGTAAGNFVNNKKGMEKDATSFDEGKNMDLGTKGLNDVRNLRPKNHQHRVSFIKRRRCFYEVSSGDIDAYWVVKQRVQIFWPLDEKWYFGVVKAYDPESKRHHVKYDDNDEEWLDLQRERFKLLLHPTEIMNRASAENLELKMNLEDDPIGSWAFCTSVKVSGRLRKTVVSKKKDFSLVYVRRRLNNRRFENLPKLVWRTSFERSLLSWLRRLPRISVHGKLVPVWKSVRLEMAVIDNFIGLRIFSFEGHLAGAVDLLCFVISRFCQKKVVRRNTELESERKQPCTSIGIKVSGLYVQTTEIYLLSYRFHEFGILEWGLLESRMRKRNCLLMKKLAVAKCTDANLRKVSSGKDLLFPSLYDGSLENLHEDSGYQSISSHKMDSPVVLFFHQTSRSIHPSLFLSTHLKSLTDKINRESSLLSLIAWDTKTQLISVSPTSVLPMNGCTPRSKKRRTLVSYSPLSICDNDYSNNKPHFRKRHSWTCSNTSYIPQVCTPTAPIRIIPTPGAYLIDEQDDVGSELHYVRDSIKYHREVRTEVERALEPAHVLYDMDSSDEEWFKRYSCDALSEDIFEQMMDSFEKLAYTKKSDELTALELEEIASKHEHRDSINDVYKYWRCKRQKTGLPLIRQFQAPLWEVYQKQLDEWESSNSRLHASLPHELSDKGCHEQKEKPAPFAFCLKPRGLKFLNKGVKARSHTHKKFLTSGSRCCSSPRDLDAALYSFGKKSCDNFSPHASSPSSTSSLRDMLRTGIPAELVNTRRHHDVTQSPQGCIVQSNMSDFKLHDAPAAAIHATKIAKLKREKAQLLLQKADLALYKAACACVIADAMENSSKDVTSMS